MSTSEIKPKPPEFGIAVQSWTQGNPGEAKYIGIDIFTGKCLFCVEIGISTNHVAEFCAIGHALMHSKKFDGKGHGVIYSMNPTAIKWISDKKCKTWRKPEENEKLKSNEFVDRIECWLVNQNRVPSVEKWNREAWGEVHSLKKETV